MKKDIRVTWLNSCVECGESDAAVSTERLQSEYKLNDGDDVTCKCGNKGSVEIFDNIAECMWI